MRGEEARRREGEELETRLSGLGSFPDPRLLTPDPATGGSTLALEADFASVFRELREVLRPYAEGMAVVADEPGHYYLDTHHVMANKKPLFFGAGRIGKRYVSYYLMPVYVFPDLLDGLPAGVRKRMQGKSCFNFTSLDDETLATLRDLTRRGFERYQAEGLL
jgi:hypothetical protein